jgi:hypothetical protein
LKSVEKENIKTFTHPSHLWYLWLKDLLECIVISLLDIMAISGLKSAATKPAFPRGLEQPHNTITTQSHPSPEASE